jgi:hypothetical protein
MLGLLVQLSNCFYVRHFGVGCSRCWTVEKWRTGDEAGNANELLKSVKCTNFNFIMYG